MKLTRGKDILSKLRKKTNTDILKIVYHSLFGSHLLFGYNYGLRACNFIKKRLQHRCFPVRFETFLTIPFLRNTSVAASEAFQNILKYSAHDIFARTTFISVYISYDLRSTLKPFTSNSFLINAPPNFGSWCFCNNGGKQFLSRFGFK